MRNRETAWMLRVAPDLQTLVDDVHFALIRARMLGANRKKKSKPPWRRAVRSLLPLRLACFAERPRLREIRRLAAESERLFEAATDLTRPPQEPPPVARKSTTLDGYFASGDGACFVLDRCGEPHVHSNKWRDRYGHELEAAYSADAPIRPGTCRVYPDALLPEKLAGGAFGRWRVTVEFWPGRTKAR